MAKGNGWNIVRAVTAIIIVLIAGGGAAWGIVEMRLAVHENQPVHPGWAFELQGIRSSIQSNSAKISELVTKQEVIATNQQNQLEILREIRTEVKR